MKTIDLEKPSFWQLVFAQSKVNGARYSEDELPSRNWNWPKETYLQGRIRDTRHQPAQVTREYEIAFDG